MSGASAPSLLPRRCLKVQFQPKLNVPPTSRALDQTEIAGIRCRGGVAEMGVIEQVEKFRPKFQRKPFAELVALDERDIPLLKTRTKQNVAAGVAKPGCSVGQSQCKIGGGKTARVKPLFDLLGTGAVASAVGLRRS